MEILKNNKNTGDNRGKAQSNVNNKKINNRKTDNKKVNNKKADNKKTNNKTARNNKTKKNKKRRRKDPQVVLFQRVLAGVLVLITLCLAGVSYLVDSRFAKGSYISGIYVGGKGLDSAVSEFYNLNAATLTKQVTLVNFDGETVETTRGALGFSVSADAVRGEIEKIYNRQSFMEKITSVFSNERTDYEPSITFSVNDDIFYTALGSYPTMQEPAGNAIVEPVNSKLVYDDKAKEYVIIGSSCGNKISSDGYMLLRDALKDVSVEELNLIRDLDFYEQPEIGENDETLLEYKEIYNGKLNVVINLMVDNKIFKTWYPTDFAGAVEPNYVNAKQGTEALRKINMSDPFKTNTTVMRTRVYELLEPINTFGRPHKFINHYGQELIMTGDYGWWVNYDKMTSLINTELETVFGGSTTAGDPVVLNLEIQFRQKANTFQDKNGSDVGDSYIEISLQEQYLWMVENGEVVLETPVVTGLAGTKDETPPGIFSLTYKERNGVLTGANYRTTVAYWMPFNGDIGLHDATWQSSFGGNVYLTRGSNGCINLPLDKAREIYNRIGDRNAVIVW